MVEMTIFEQVAAVIWPLVAAGAAGRIGERGADEVTTQIHAIWEQVRGQRAERGVQTPPRTQSEFESELKELYRNDARAAATMQTIVNTFNAPVDAQGANFGIVIE